MYLFFLKLINFRFKKYYSFAKKHRDNHRGGCVPYKPYIKLFYTVKKYYKEHLKRLKIKDQNKKQIMEEIKILEIGTATGFTSFVMNIACNKNCQIDTIEKNLEHILIAKEQFKKYKMDNIQIMEGKAEEILNYLNKNYYDIIFFDAFAPKEEYAIIFNKILKKNAIIISANSFLRKAEENYFNIFNDKTKWNKIGEFDDTKIWRKL